MKQRLLFSLLAPFLLPAVLQAAVVTPLHNDWRVQSACKIDAGGEAIAVAGFPVEGWLKLTTGTPLVAQTLDAPLNLTSGSPLVPALVTERPVVLSDTTISGTADVSRLKLGQALLTYVERSFLF